MAENRRATTIPLPDSLSHDLGGRIVTAGPQTWASLNILLGLDQLRSEGQSELDGWRVTATSWMDHSLEMAATDPGGDAHVIRIERRGADSKGMVLTRHLNIFCRGKDVPRELAEAIQGKAGERLAEWDMDALGALLSADPELGRPGLPSPPAADEEERPRSLLDTWGEQESYADFFARGEMARSQLDSVDPSKLFSFVQHCDSECLFVNPHSMGTIVPLINFPWDERVRSPFQSDLQGMANLTDEDFVQDGMVTSDLDENDVIMGNPDKLKNMLEYATSRPGAGKKLLFVSNTCVPTVTGEDVESVVKNVREKTGLPILYLTVTPRSMNNVFHNLLVEQRLEAEAAAPLPKPNTVNLIGFMDNRSRTELIDLLNGYSISLNECILPDLTPESVQHLPNASLNVFYPNQLWQNLYDHILEGSRTPDATIAAPFGLEGTRKWIEAVAEALSIDLDSEAVWGQAVEPHIERWERLREQAKECRLAFVVRDREAYHLTTPNTTWGVPLLALCEEMGFGVDVLLSVSDPKVARESATNIQDALGDPDRATISAFADFEHLRARLRESKSDALLTYHFFDWRATEAGMSTFSIQHFEPGLAGAIRSLERLLQVCNTSFYKHLGKYLGRTKKGLRVPVEGPLETQTEAQTANG